MCNRVTNHEDIGTFPDLFSHSIGAPLYLNVMHLLFIAFISKPHLPSKSLITSNSCSACFRVFAISSPSQTIYKEKGWYVESLISVTTMITNS